MVAVTVKDVDPHQFIKAYAAHLKRSGKLEIPKWVDLVKTGSFKELAPSDPDWFFHRVASIARHVYLKKGLGVGTFRRYYSGPVNRGSKPSRNTRASGAVIRKALQALEKVKVIEVDSYGGRKITQIGQQELDRIAHQVASQ